MSIDKELHQSHFRNENHKALLNFIFTSNWIGEKIKKILEPEGITGQQYNILRILKSSDKPLSTLQIRQRMLDRMSDTSRIVDRLIAKGWAKKNICRRDKRLVDISITDNGRLLLEKMVKYESLIDNLMGNLKKNELMELNKMLDKIREIKKHDA